ncbi:ST8SIA5 [Branchiostoma lanceolatum]|uniref:ST8SIA5 protein n=1 Tax=Branchiostoma lanceolatum TaxID=7740 RepID=A0A8J9YKW6_BRALA|nr:ST8SIA5 [Branchiostoma lanceolatum]
MVVSKVKRLSCHCLHVFGWLMLAGQMLWGARLVTEDTACNCAAVGARPSIAVDTKVHGWDVKNMRRIFEMPGTEEFPDKEEAQMVLQDDPSLLGKLPDREFDKQAVEKMRAELLEKTAPREYLYATKKNLPIGAIIHFLEESDKTAKRQILPIHHRAFPEDIQLPNSTLRRCSVVQNGGILRGSRCGKEIDSADYVFRDDIPPLTYQALHGKDGDYVQHHVTYYKDVGNKTNFVTASPSLLLHYLDTAEEKDLVVLRRHLKQYKEPGSLIWTHMFDTEKKAQLVLRIMFYGTILKRMGMVSTMVTSHQRFLQGVQDFWKELNLKTPRASHGLMLTAISMALCEETHLYGVWPFPVDYEGRQVPYRYYYGHDSDMKLESSEYDLQEEFDLLRMFHKRGLLKLHIGECRD